MERKPGLLAKLDSARANAMIDSCRGASNTTDTLDEILNPGRKQIVRLTDEELAELLARNRNGRETQLAASEMRRRESWRTPARRPGPGSDSRGKRREKPVLMRRHRPEKSASPSGKVQMQCRWLGSTQIAMVSKGWRSAAFA